MEKTYVCSPQKGDVRDAEGSTDILQRYIKIAEVIWFCNKPILSMRCKQVDKQMTNHRGMARRRHESITQK